VYTHITFYNEEYKPLIYDDIIKVYHEQKNDNSINEIILSKNLDESAVFIREIGFKVEIRQNFAQVIDLDSKVMKISELKKFVGSYFICKDAQGYRPKIMSIDTYYRIKNFNKEHPNYMKEQANNTEKQIIKMNLSDFSKQLN
jgi:hypothetical protein